MWSCRQSSHAMMRAQASGCSMWSCRQSSHAMMPCRAKCDDHSVRGLPADNRGTRRDGGKSSRMCRNPAPRFPANPIRRKGDTNPPRSPPPYTPLGPNPLSTRAVLGVTRDTRREWTRAPQEASRARPYSYVFRLPTDIACKHLEPRSNL
jgi:hypothetical protein